MKKLLLTFILLATASFAQTRNLVPKASGEGSIGATNSQWDALYVGSLYLNGQSIDNYLPTNVGVTSINGLLGDVGFEAGRGFMSSNVGSTIYLNLLTNDFVVGTNIATYRFTGGEQYFQVPATVTNMKAWLWGGGGGGGTPSRGGAGGYTEVEFPVLPLEILTLVVGEGGQFSGYGQTTQLVTTTKAYPQGGRGVSARSNESVGGGGGRSQILRGSLSITNLARTVAVAGGGGGGSDAAGGSGGGDSGGDGGENHATHTDYGGGAYTIYVISSTNVNIYTNDSVITTSFVYAVESTGYSGGYSKEYIGTMSWTNQPGSLFFGGDGGLVNQTNAGWVGAGGDGFYGGGGGWSQVGGYYASGGGGMGFVNKDLGVKGRTIRGVGTDPSGAENPYFISGTGIGGNQLIYPGGNGLIILQY